MASSSPGMGMPGDQADQPGQQPVQLDKQHDPGRGQPLDGLGACLRGLGKVWV